MALRLPRCFAVCETGRGDWGRLPVASLVSGQGATCSKFDFPRIRRCARQPSWILLPTWHQSGVYWSTAGTAESPGQCQTAHASTVIAAPSGRRPAQRSHCATNSARGRRGPGPLIALTVRIVKSQSSQYRKSGENAVFTQIMCLSCTRPRSERQTVFVFIMLPPC